MFQKYKKIIIVAAALVVLFVVYTVFFKKDEEPVISRTSSAGQALSAENNELITLLSQLRSIDLDRGIFSNAVYLSLFDFSVVLIPEPVSRPNPFAPIGSEGVTPQVQNEGVANVGAGL